MHTQKSQKVSNSDKETLKKQQKVPKSAKKKNKKKIQKCQKVPKSAKPCNKKSDKKCQKVPKSCLYKTTMSKSFTCHIFGQTNYNDGSPVQ